jgi:predicted flap endonuclease-1-like 5' DNA nuclease
MKIDDVEGIGPVYAAQLVKVGIKTTDDLLEKGCTPKGREEIEKTTGIGHALVLKWVNRVDLYRINGVGSEFSDLLEIAGVDSVPELAQRNPANLYQAVAGAALQRQIVRRVPNEEMLADWIAQAKKLPRVVEY